MSKQEFKNLLDFSGKHALEYTPYGLLCVAISIWGVIVLTLKYVFDVTLSHKFIYIGFVVSIVTIIIRSFWINTKKTGPKQQKILLALVGNTLSEDNKLFNDAFRKQLCYTLSAELNCEVVIPRANRCYRYLFNYLLKGYPSLNKYQNFYLKMCYKLSNASIIVFGSSNSSTMNDKKIYNIYPSIYTEYNEKSIVKLKSEELADFCDQMITIEDGNLLIGTKELCKSISSRCAEIIKPTLN